MKRTTDSSPKLHSSTVGSSGGGVSTPTDNTTPSTSSTSSTSTTSTTKRTISSTTSSSSSTLRTRPLSSVTLSSRTPSTSKSSTLPSSMPSEQKRTVSSLKSSGSSLSSRSTPSILKTSSSSSSSTGSSSSSTRPTSTTRSTTTLRSRTGTTTSTSTSTSSSSSKASPEIKSGGSVAKPPAIDGGSISSSTSSTGSQEYERVVSEFIDLDDKPRVPPPVSNTADQQTFLNDPLNPIVIDDSDGEEEEEEENTGDVNLDTTTDELQQITTEDDDVVGENETADDEQQVDQGQEEDETVEEAAKEEEPVETISTKKSGGWLSSLFNLIPKQSNTMRKSQTISSASPSTSSEFAQPKLVPNTSATESSEQRPNNQPIESSSNIVYSPPPPVVHSMPPPTNVQPMHAPPPHLQQHQQHQPHHMPHHLSTNSLYANPQQAYSHSRAQSSPMLMSNPNNNNVRHSQQLAPGMFNPNMFQAHNQPNGVALLPFVIAPAKALSIFHDWHKSLWFAPTNFREHLEQSLQLNYYFIPYYNFGAAVTSVHRGQIGHIKSDQQQQVVMQGDNKPETYNEDEIEWTNAMTNPYPQTYSDILVYAPCDFVDAPIYEDIKEIQYWKLDIGEQYSNGHPQLTQPIYEPARYYPLSHQYQHHHSPTTQYNPSLLMPPPQMQLQQQQQPPQQTNIDPMLNKIPTVITPMAMESAWTYAETKIKRNESYGNEVKLKKDHFGHTVANVETETQVDSFTFRTIYAPVYKITYNFEGTQYSFIVNGQNGNSHGVRPYGIGSIKNTAIKFLTAGLFESKVSTTASSTTSSNTITANGMILGSDLDVVDGDQYYKPDLYYMLLPSSDQFLMIKTTGYIVLKNNGQSPIKIESHKRMSGETGGECIIDAGASMTFSYKGTWCICVVEGVPSSLELVRAETNSGGDKPEGDLLMVSS
ncbi:hypothetical protein SAMD00019534_050220 [Acytostelium subglobosum LB1]|uniref:hypothetical protein n=1 Tax=Acytostelium subglobosum LB1 TaxID=1410327 RepID=UPI00064500FB|nr:hypothetical protein SAMD00019534_050220 [Acytostelium subglobosum LB1]GAM21847.1 hypothetical protein SAMD00019534_050220 [Acytostelium subglobosum LB1]|eukprot:XP_012754947.1 hypothetical protein SAMD00019534_050220 [Acytostelium subglobosum LB1]